MLQRQLIECISLTNLISHTQHGKESRMQETGLASVLGEHVEPSRKTNAVGALSKLIANQEFCVLPVDIIHLLHFLYEVIMFTISGVGFHSTAVSPRSRVWGSTAVVNTSSRTSMKIQEYHGDPAKILLKSPNCSKAFSGCKITSHMITRHLFSLPGEKYQQGSNKQYRSSRSSVVCPDRECR